MAPETLNGHAMPSVTIEEVKVDIEASETNSEEKAGPEANGAESTGNDHVHYYFVYFAWSPSKDLKRHHLYCKSELTNSLMFTLFTHLLSASGDFYLHLMSHPPLMRPICIHD